MLNKKAKDDFKKIIGKDYGQDITDEQAGELGASLLRLTRVGLAVLARKYEREKLTEVEEKHSTTLSIDSVVRRIIASV